MFKKLIKKNYLIYHFSLFYNLFTFKELNYIFVK